MPEEREEPDKSPAVPLKLQQTRDPKALEETKREWEKALEKMDKMELPKIDEVNSLIYTGNGTGASSIMPYLKEDPPELKMLSEETKAPASLPQDDLTSDDPVIQLPDYLDPKLSVVLTSGNNKKESTELKNILHESEEAFVGETVENVQKQLLESDIEKQKLQKDNRELTTAVSELTGLLESALDELKEYRVKYGELYK